MSGRVSAPPVGGGVVGAALAGTSLDDVTFLGLTWNGSTDTLSSAFPVEDWTAASLTVDATDVGKVLHFIGGGNTTLNLPDPSTLPAGAFYLLASDATAEVTVAITPANPYLIDGEASISVSRGDRRIILQDGGDYYSFHCGQPYESVGLQLAGNSAVLANNTFWFTLNAPFAATIYGLTYRTGAGSFNVAIQINGVDVTGLSAVAVSSSTKATATASAANTVARGDTITAVVTGAASSPTDAVLTLLLKRV